MSPRSLIEAVPAPHTLSLSFADVPIRVRTNDPEIQKRLASYFRPYATGDDAAPLAEVSLIQGPAPIDGEFVDVPRTGGRRPSAQPEPLGVSASVQNRGEPGVSAPGGNGSPCCIGVSSGG